MKPTVQGTHPCHLKLPNVKRQTEERPRQCPYCEGATFQRWGQVNKPVKDVQVRKVKVYRYRCCHCRRTFRCYPEGITSADQTERLRLFAVLLWSVGLSHRASSLILSGLRAMVSFMAIWRDVQAQSQKMKRQNSARLQILAGHGIRLGAGCNLHSLTPFPVYEAFCLSFFHFSPAAYVTETASRTSLKSLFGRAMMIMR